MSLFSIFKKHKKKLFCRLSADLSEIDIFLETHKIIKLTEGEVNTVGPAYPERGTWDMEGQLYRVLLYKKLENP